MQKKCRLFSLANIFNKRGFSTRRAVYTAITGDCDIMPVIQNYVRDGWRYICYTDNKTLIKLKYFGNWEIRPLEFVEMDDTKNARWHKTHPQVLFKDYDETLWIDANINIKTPYIFELIENLCADLLIPKHFCRHCIWQEIAAVRAYEKDIPENIDKVISFLEKHNMPRNFGLNETNVIYSKNTQSNIKIFAEWWNLIEEYSKRDQLTFSYVLWKNNIDINKIFIPNARIDVANYELFPHNPRKTLTGKLLTCILKK